jgi:hypothetical protein
MQIASESVTLTDCKPVGLQQLPLRDYGALPQKPRMIHRATVSKHGLEVAKNILIATTRPVRFFKAINEKSVYLRQSGATSAS